MTETKTLKDKIADFEKEEILNALRESNWIIARAARKLGITERMAGYKIKKYGIKNNGQKQTQDLSCEINKAGG